MIGARYLRAGLCLAAAGLLASACATRPSGAPGAQRPGRSSAMVSGDSSGLGITGEETPAALKAIVVAPYAVASPPDCAVMAREIADLDVLLGPDVDSPEVRQGLEHSASQALGSAMRGAIPYRWVLRLITQAGDRDRDLRVAILAGTARRSFLKGASLGRGCQGQANLAAR